MSEDTSALDRVYRELQGSDWFEEKPAPGLNSEYGSSLFVYDDDRDTNAEWAVELGVTDEDIPYLRVADTTGRDMDGFGNPLEGLETGYERSSDLREYEVREAPELSSKGFDVKLSSEDRKVWEAPLVEALEEELDARTWEEWATWEKVQE
ncbi:MAG: hypothetical protein ABEJ03_05220 [Candidatus Nanohaloarchaea archaeon]